jgi:hypothetical protein
MRKILKKLAAAVGGISAMMGVGGFGAVAIVALVFSVPQKPPVPASGITAAVIMPLPHLRPTLPGTYSDVDSAALGGVIEEFRATKDASKEATPDTILTTQGDRADLDLLMEAIGKLEKKCGADAQCTDKSPVAVSY